ncbi:MAG: RimK family alpha-L-glutamate ligase [Bradyrhizobiaceae bacterium]|nr:RimK family alpha-L-glutamate ligase [Hyphomicrobiales bacterium]MBV9426577.1 RimK family alpha-L-glutamate ligase [Bradyrhizobiaceae bacterium]
MPPSPDTLVAEPARAAPRIALVVDRFDWHARQLEKEFAARGARCVPMRLDACRFATQSASGLMLDGFGERLPDAVVVRTMSGGTFEAVTLRLGILHALRELGVPVWNDARAIERCVDKSMTSFLLARAGIATPPTWTMESTEAARAIVRAKAGEGPLVLKPLFGSQGRGLRLIRAPEDLPAARHVAGVYYLQRYVAAAQDGVFRDFRVFVSQGRVIASMVRHATSWVTNVKRGGRPMAGVIGGEIKDLAVRAAAAVGATFAGVDLIIDADGHPAVLEVNSMPAWAGVQKVTPTNIAAVLAADLMAALDAWTVRGARA